MSQGKENAATLSSTLRQQKIRRSDRPLIPNPRYADDEGARGGQGRGRARRGGGGRGGGGVELEASQLPSASGDVASELQLEVESTDEGETEYRDDAKSTQEAGVEVEAAPKKVRLRGEAKVPNEDKEPKTEEAKALIEPNGIE